MQFGFLVQTWLRHTVGQHEGWRAQEEGTSAGLDGGARMTRGARTADEAKPEGDLAPVTYNYAFFHLIFALASTYIAMLMTRWVAQEGDVLPRQVLSQHL